uniref:Uncharacterized protein n=1 Tax=Solanum tuberosum TaxID=4113 RepID=M1DL81_SOLTU
MSAAIAGQMRLKSKIKLQKCFIPHFLTLRAKERTQSFLDSFPPFLRLKTTNKREESGKGRFKCLGGFKLGFEVGDGCDFMLV